MMMFWRRWIWGLILRFRPGGWVRKGGKGKAEWDMVVWVDDCVCGRGEGGVFGVGARWLIWCCVIRFADGGF